MTPRKLRYGLSSVLALAAIAVTFAQSPSATGLVMGVVVDPLTDRPVAVAVVTLSGGSAETLRVLTDGEGRFAFLDLPKGTYVLTVAKPGYADGAHGRRRPAGPAQSLTLAADERLGDLQISIWKNATITGMVTDEAGDPMIEVPVHVLARSFVAGRRVLSPGATAKTDDRGYYRIASLTPGEYVVVVPSTQTSAPESVVDLYRAAQAAGRAGGPSDFARELTASGAATALNMFVRSGGVRVGGLSFQSSTNGTRSGVAPMPSVDGRMFVYPTQYFPAATSPAAAAPIRLRSGEERTGVDLQLTLVPTSQVSGTVTGPNGPLTVGLALSANADGLATDAGFETATTLSDASGRFTFLGVPEGQYVLRVIKTPPAQGRGAPPPTSPSGPTLWTTQPVAVGRSDVRDLVVTLREGFTIAGRLEFTGDTSPPAADVLRRAAPDFESADGRPAASVTVGRGVVGPGGDFWSYQMPQGRYLIRVLAAPAGWTFNGAMLNGRDISNVPLLLDQDFTGVVLRFTDRPAKLSGRVTGESGAADAFATVLIFPPGSASWVDYGNNPPRLRAVRVDRSGTYTSGPLPAGDYLVVAVADDESEDWQDPATLRRLVRVATTVKLVEGDNRQLELRAVAVPR